MYIDKGSLFKVCLKFNEHGVIFREKSRLLGPLK